MTRNAETPDTPAAGGSRPVDGPSVQAGPVAELGLVAAGLGLVIYLIAFVTDLGGGATSLVLPLLLGGGLLAGTVALPSVGSRVLAPAAVVTTTGALLLLRAVVDGGGGALEVGALVLGLLEAGAAVGATLMHAGVARSRPPKARRAASSAFSGQPGDPRFPGQQYPGQPHPGTAVAGAPAVGPYPDDQWTGEHAYGQNAQYGGQYGVPGYPPPPPHGAPGLDPAPYGPEAPAVAGGADVPGDTASPPRGARPVTGLAAGAEHGSGYWSSAGTGSHGVVADPDAATGTGSYRAVPDPGAVSGTGSFRSGSPSAVPEGTGAPRVSGTGAFPPAAESSPVPGADPYRPRTAGRHTDDAHTRTLPAVPDDQYS